MKQELKLKPTYWASISGGKDSFYMLNLILNNLESYKLDGVIHFELEIDYPFIKDVISLIKEKCSKNGIAFYSIKPSKTWVELYQKYGYPSRLRRWCNSVYKLDCKKQFNDFMKTQGYDVYYYIGYCVDENKRYEHRKLNELYPLVDYNIEENVILNWAKEQQIYNDYYKVNKRCGCMGCPMMSMTEFAYFYKYYPKEFKYFYDKMLETEKRMSEEKGKKMSIWSSNSKYDSLYRLEKAKTKYLTKIEEIIKGGEIVG